MGRAARRENDDDIPALSAAEAAREAFLEVQALSKQWMEKEREGISLIESFQTAILACRATLATAAPTAVNPRSAKRFSAMTAFVDGSDGVGGTMDPWVAEDLFGQIQELRGAFTELLEQAYASHASVKAAYLDETAADCPVDVVVLTTAEYVQFIAHEIATFEAEYQHVEALLAMISFDITTDQLRTLVISWSTSPFLDPERSRQLRQCHEQSQKLRS